MNNDPELQRLMAQQEIFENVNSTFYFTFFNFIRIYS